MDTDITVLEVINGDASDPVEYAAIVRKPLDEEIRFALVQLDIKVDQKTVDEIARALRRHDVHWLYETHCFTTVTVG